MGLDLPEPAKAAKPTLDLPPSAKLSILSNGPKDFKGRKMGILLTDGSSADLFAALTKALEAEGALWEVVASKIGGVTLEVICDEDVGLIRGDAKFTDMEKEPGVDGPAFFTRRSGCNVSYIALTRPCAPPQTMTSPTAWQ